MNSKKTTLRGTRSIAALLTLLAVACGGDGAADPLQASADRQVQPECPGQATGSSSSGGGNTSGGASSSGGSDGPSDGGTVAPAPGDPVNPNANAAARGVLARLRSFDGQHTVSGTHQYTQAAWGQYFDQFQQKGGEYPGLYGNDFAWSELASARQGLVEPVTHYWSEGSLVTLSFHQSKPEIPNGGWGEVQGHYSLDELESLVTPGSELYGHWETEIDEIAGYLAQLRDAGVPVLWRPYHEMNGGWFWWGAGPNDEELDARGAIYRRLWVNMYERFTNVHHLDNLLWVFSVAGPDGEWAAPLEPFYPGAEYVDVVALDTYDPGFPMSSYEAVTAVAGDKPVALSEVGSLPDPDALGQPRWAYYMVWGNYMDGISSEAVTENVQNTRTLTQGELGL